MSAEIINLPSQRGPDPVAIAAKAAAMDDGAVLDLIAGDLFDDDLSALKAYLAADDLAGFYEEIARRALAIAAAEVS